jgi:seryl-tRNA synthetase
MRAYLPHINTAQDDNATIRTWHPEGPNSQVEKRTDILAHHEVLLRLDAMDLERGAPSVSSIHSLIISFSMKFVGAKISGHRGYFLTNDGIDLNQALISYGLDFLRKRGYRKIQPPFMMNKDIMGKTAQLDQFDEELYKVQSTPDCRMRLRNPPCAYRSLEATTKSTLLLLRNSPSRHSTRMSGSKIPKNSFRSSTLAIQHVSAKRLVRLAVTCGASFACISSRRSNNFALPNQKSPGKCSIR